jgi:NifU-like protein involved in Fe-S cluster formation
MSRFSETLMDHFQSPMNRGAMEQAYLVGKGSLDGYPPFLTLYLRTDGNRVVDAKYEAKGCGVTMACGSVLTELIRGHTLADSRQINADDLSQALDGLPSGKECCAEVAIRALKDALRGSGVERQTYVELNKRQQRQQRKVGGGKDGWEHSSPLINTNQN